MSVDTEIRDRSLGCLESFRACLLDPRLSKLGCFERYCADFKLWIFGLKASSTGKASLDYRVRQRADVRAIICDLLDGLSETLQSCIEAAEELEEIEDLCFDIQAVLKQLSRIHVAIRRAGSALRHQKADAALQSAIEGSAYQDWKQEMENVILTRVEDRDQFRGLSKTFELKRDRQEALNAVQARVIQMNLIRRHRIQYACGATKMFRQKEANLLFRDDGKSETTKMQSEQHIPSSQEIMENVGPQLPGHRTSGLVGGNRAASKTETSGSQRTATDIPNNWEPRTNLHTSPSVITRATQTGRKQDYPRWPKRAGDERDVLCPYCTEPLSRDYVNDEERWRCVDCVAIEKAPMLTCVG